MSVDRRLRVALWTWSRRDRRATGEIALDTALDLIEAGGSVGREARSLARTGLTLRVRGSVRDLRTAPWRSSLPLIAMLTASAVVAIVATDAGGWSQMWSGGDALVSRVLVASAALVILAAATRQPRLTFIVQGSLALCVAQWWLVAPNLGDHGIAFEPDGPMFLSSDMAFADVPLIAVAGLLLCAGLVAGLAWVLLNFSHWRAPAESPEASRLSWGVAAACLAFPVVAPRIGQMLLELSRSLLSGTANGLNMDAQPVFLLLAIWLLIFAVAVGARRRWPALTVAACLSCAALWIPFVLVTSPFVYGPADEPFNSTTAHSLSTTLALWTTATVFAIAVAVSLIASAGRAAGTSSGAAASTQPGTRGPMVPA